MKQSEQDSLDEIKKAFHLFDPDNSGITFEKLKRVAIELGEELTDEEIREMIREASASKIRLPLSPVSNDPLPQMIALHSKILPLLWPKPQNIDLNVIKLWDVNNL